MSMHKQPASYRLVEALKKHRLSTDKPSQLADAFRQGWYAHKAQEAEGTKVNKTVKPIRVLVANKCGLISVCDTIRVYKDKCVVRPIDGKAAFTVTHDETDRKVFNYVSDAITWIEQMTAKKKTKVKIVRKIFEDSATYKKREREMQTLYSPKFKPCNTCGSPRHESYGCRYCEGE